MNAYSSPRGVAHGTSNIFGYKSIDSLDSGALGPARLTTVIKFARILDEEPAKVNWQNYEFCNGLLRHVRVRRVVTLEDHCGPRSSRSLKRLDRYSRGGPFLSLSPYSRRKIATIVEDEQESDQSVTNVKTPPRLPITDGVIRPMSQDLAKKPPSLERNSASNQNLSRLSVLKKCNKDLKISSKFGAKVHPESTHKVNNKSKFSCNTIDTRDSGRPVFLKVKDLTSKSKSLASTVSSKQNIKLNDIEKGFNKLSVKNGILNTCKDSNVVKNISTQENKNSIDKPKNVAPQKSPKPFTNVQSKVNTFLKKKQAPNLGHCKPVHNIYNISQSISPVTMMSVTSISRDAHPLFHTDVEANHRGAQVMSDDLYETTVDRSGTTSQIAIEKPKTQNQSTETINTDVAEKKQVKETEIQTEDVCDNITVKDLCLPSLLSMRENEDLGTVILESHSLPNLQLPPFKISSRKKSYEEINSRNSSKSTSILIGEATVTYTTQKKINFQVVGSADVMENKLAIEPYPYTVMTILKKELNTKEKINNSHKDSSTEKELVEHKTEICQWPDDFKEKLMAKSSDIIRKIKGNDNLLDADYFCEQFQKELNFIESFMDSLQYLENSWMSDTNTAQQQARMVQSWKDGQLKSEELLSKLHPGDVDIPQNVQMTANKSICLLNLLIRDEHRRSKNLLFVLKMREDALKDFTKSQILWLENKKKTEDMDVSTLKKKQRGVLLKLQQECGEMQRMKKALLALSERRKAALIQTKRNIELKLSKGTQVERIMKNGKKKLHRPSLATSKPARSLLPLKCFDLSGSSYCGEESLEKEEQIEKLFSTSDTSLSNIMTLKSEKCIQTGDSIMEMKEEFSKSSSQFVKVDGGYLNILFHNLALPEIFSFGKEYEVNEGALQNILNSANRLQESLLQESSDMVEKYLNQGKIQDKSLSKSSTPSTARSLIEEYDEYFHNLGDNDNKIETPKKPCITLNTAKIQKETTILYERELHSTSMETCTPLESRNNSTSLELSCKETSTSSKSSDIIKNDEESSCDDSKRLIGLARGSESILSDRKCPSLELSVGQSQISSSDIKSNAVNVIKSTWSLQNSQSWTSGPRHSSTSTSTDDSLVDDKYRAILLPSASLPALSEAGVKPQGSLLPTGTDVKPQRPMLPAGAEIKPQSSILAVGVEVKPQVSLLTTLTEAEIKPPRALLPTLPETEVKPQSLLRAALTEAEMMPQSVAVPTFLEERVASLPTLSEAEVLRKKQLAIELEIKALEQQQSQMFIVREIPDKPPPPYTPPSTAETAAGPHISPPLPSAGFSAGKSKLAECLHVLCQQLPTSTASTTNSDLFKATGVQVTDSFLEFLNDFCTDGVNKHTVRASDRPWSPSNLIPPRLGASRENIRQLIEGEALQVLGCTPKAPLPGPELLNKRSDYIDDILFTEWRRCEPEWTNLEADEISVKNQIVESIFDKVLEESIQEYKSIVMSQFDSDTDSLTE